MFKGMKSPVRFNIFNNQTKYTYQSKQTHQPTRIMAGLKNKNAAVTLWPAKYQKSMQLCQNIVNKYRN